MGSGVSSDQNKANLCVELKLQKLKPVDGSDLSDIHQARIEIEHIRSLLQQIDPNKLKNLCEEKEGELLKNDIDNVENADVDKLVTKMGSLESEIIIDSVNEKDKIESVNILNKLQDKLNNRFDSLQEGFAKIDTYGSGTISRDEFMRICGGWGVNVADNDVDILDLLRTPPSPASATHSSDASEKTITYETTDKCINYDKFVSMFSTKHNVSFNEERTDRQKEHVAVMLREKVMDSVDTLKTTFNKFDTDHSGSIDATELKCVLDNYNIECSEAEFAQLFAVYDTNGDGKFSYFEFVKLVQNSELGLGY